MRFKATIAYDGTAYHGFQRQGKGRTIQQEVERVLSSIADEAVGVIGAGRTDAGVHATGQVIAFDLMWRHSTDALRLALNVNLPDDIAVREVVEALPEFHPRYDAWNRSYVYRVYIAEVRDPLRRYAAWHVAQPLNVAVMRDAAANLIGEHDFSSFGRPPQGENPVRTIIEAAWDEVGDELRFTITANAFLFRMVRSIVGTLVMVGRGEMTAEGFQGILAARNRALAGPPAPPYGLILAAVSYGENL